MRKMYSTEAEKVAQMDIIEFAEWLTDCKLLDHQKEFFRIVVEDDTRNVVVTSPRGGGKTWSAAIVCAYYLTHRKNYKIVIAAGSRDQATRMMGYVSEWFYTKLNMFLKHRTDISRTTLKVPYTNSKLTVIASSEQSRRGEHSNLLIIDEAESISEEAILEYMGIPTLDPSRIIVLSTPAWDKTFSFFRSLFTEADKYGYARVRWTSEDSRKIPGWEKAYEREKLKAGYNKAWFLTQFEAEFAAEEGLVFHNLEKCILYGRNIDNRPQPKYNHPIRIGIDWGYTHHTAIVVAQRINDEVYILESFGFHGVPYATITQHLINKYNKYKEYTDDVVIISDASAMGAEKIAELQSYGLAVVGVPFTLEKVSHLIPNAVAWVENAKVKIWEGESKLLSQMSSYYWEHSGGRIKTKKTNDDYVDAFMLALRDWRFIDYINYRQPEQLQNVPLVKTFLYNETSKFLEDIGHDVMEM